jgi:hypothetical protein
MRLPRLILVALAIPAIAFADPAPASTPAPSPAKASCTRKVVGKGLDRHVVCEIDQTVWVKTSAKPSVIVVPRDPRGLVGRPQSSDRLDGLSHQLRQ